MFVGDGASLSAFGGNLARAPTLMLYPGIFPGGLGFTHVVLQHGRVQSFAVCYGAFLEKQVWFGFVYVCCLSLCKRPPWLDASVLTLTHPRVGISHLEWTTRSTKGRRNSGSPIWSRIN